MTAGDRVGRYELVRLLGRGGTGEVWEAVLQGPHGFRKRVALKLLRSERTTDDHRSSLVHEARLGALLSHPNVAATLELGEVDGRWFVAMELVEGPSAADLIRRDALPPAVVLDLGQQAAAALEHVHGLRVDGVPAGLVHRDVKPQNLLVDRHGVVKLVDLGIASLAGHATRAAGTPAWMAPEQRDGRAGPASDLFSLGATLYALATRRKPFGSGLDALASASRVDELLADPAFLAPVDAAVPGLGGVVARCLRHDPGARWPDAAALGDALRRLLPSAPPGPTLASIARGAPAADPARAPAAAAAAETVLLTGNLPRAADRFVGRDAEVAELRRRAAGGAPLITVTGPGGMGKTRLAVEAARGLDAAGGVWFFDLAEARSFDALCAAVAHGLGLVLTDRDPAERIGRALAARGRQIVVLDNFEQAVEHAPRTVGRWLDLAPRTTFVVTSRLRLDLRGEDVLVLAPLAAAAAVELFLSRARTVPEADRPAVVALVERLDRLPLAIELAAARTGVMSARAILARVDDQLRLLAGGARDRPERHRSLRASLDFSWDLLAPWERSAFAQLSVFVGGLQLDAAEAVLHLPPDAPWTLDVLSRLVDHSLVRFDRETGRFSMLVVVTAYAADRLDPADRAAAERRHAAWFAQLVHARFAGQGPEEVDRVQAELGNLEAAARRAAAAGDGDAAADAAIAAGRVWIRRGPFADGLALLGPLRDLPATRSAELAHQLGVLQRAAGAFTDAAATQALALERARAAGDEGLQVAILSEQAQAETLLGRPADGLRLAEQACRLADSGAVGDQRRALALTVRGLAQVALGRLDEARALYDAALAARRRCGDRRGEATLLDNVGVLLFSRDELEEALAWTTRALEGMRAEGMATAEGTALGHLGSILDRLGRFDEARHAHEAALALHRSLGDRRSEAVTLTNLGSHLVDAGDRAAARAALDAAVALHREMRVPRSEAIATANVGRLLLQEGRVDEAVATFDQALALAERAQAPAIVTVLTWFRGLGSEAAGDLPDARARVSSALPGLQAEPRALAEALLDLARIERAAGRADESRAALARAESLARGRRGGEPTLIRLLLLRGSAADVAEARRLGAELRLPATHRLARELEASVVRFGRPERRE